MGIGKKIISARKQLNLTQAALARLIGQKPPVVSHWEKEDYNPSPKNLAILAKKLRKPVSYFHEETVPTFSLPNHDNPLLPPAIGVGHDGEVIFIGRPPTKEEAMKRKQDWIEIKDDSFLPHFKRGDVVVWDYTLPAKPGVYVLVELDADKHTFGLLKGKALTDLHDKPLHGKIIASVLQKLEKSVLYK